MEEKTRVIAEQLAKKNVTPEVIAGYEMIQGAVSALMLAADHAEAKNYIEITMAGLHPPFDRAAIHLVRPGGKTPHEVRLAAESEIGGLRVQLRLAESAVEDRERANAQLRERVRELEAQLGKRGD